MTTMHYKASYEHNWNKQTRVIKSPVEITLWTNLDNLLNWDYFRWCETSGNIEEITLEEITEDTYKEIRLKKEAIGLIIGDNFSVESKEVL